jgi:lysophospholipase L1-like esterase
MKYGNIELHNVCDILENDGQPGIGISRLPLSVLPAINKGAAKQSHNGTGCEIRGMLPEGGKARIVLQTMHSNSTVPVVTVYHGCFCGQSVVAAMEPTEIVIKVPDRIELMANVSRVQGHTFDPRLVRVRLPPIHTTRILSIEGDLIYPEPAATPASTLLCYGSSITHGACATIPEGTYAAQCARALGYDLINLGFGGSAQMDPAIANHIAARTDWDVATLEMGINVRNWPLEQFRCAVEQFVSTIVAAHPRKPVFCIDLFTYFDDFEEAPTLAVGFREAIQEIVRATDSPFVHHVDGREILRQAAGLRTDMVHPSDTGMQEMGQNLATRIAATDR